VCGCTNSNDKYTHPIFADLEVLSRVIAVGVFTTCEQAQHALEKVIFQCTAVLWYARAVKAEEQLRHKRFAYTPVWVDTLIKHAYSNSHLHARAATVKP
jgi:predicted CoA-binding protein